MITFLGTAGARYVTIRQLRRNAGVWFNLEGTQLLVDPGPGSLYTLLHHDPPFLPHTLDGILLSHRHIDHSNDINILMEAMSEGGRTPRGTVLAPNDALNDDPVILHHFRDRVQTLSTFTEGGTYQIKDVTITTPVQHKHGVETYGFLFETPNLPKIGFITDTQYFPGIEQYYQADILIINVVLPHRTQDYILHLDLEDVKQIISTNKPKLTILNHFGMNMLRANPEHQADLISKETGFTVLAAQDDMQINLEDYK